VKIVALCAALAAVGCASAAAPSGGVGEDLSGVGTGGVGSPDLAVDSPTPGTDLSAGGGGGGGTTGPVDLAVTTPAPDLATTIPPPVDMAKPVVPPDLAKPVIPPDMTTTAPVCTPTISGSACNVFPQCGCASGQNCNVENMTTGAAQCVAPGTVGLWGSCDPLEVGANGDGVCVVGSSCVDGVCSPFCGVDADCGGPHRSCVQVQSVNSSTGAATSIPGFLICLSYCDPTSPQSSANGYAACGAGVNCFGNTNGSSYCSAPVTGSGTQGKVCTGTFYVEDATLCAIGFACVGNASLTAATCYKQCHVSGGTECTGTQTCHSQSTKVYAGTPGTATEIGYCK
jgi:hypothetical protein